MAPLLAAALPWKQEDGDVCYVFFFFLVSKEKQTASGDGKEEIRRKQKLSLRFRSDRVVLPLRREQGERENLHPKCQLLHASAADKHTFYDSCPPDHIHIISVFVYLNT